MTQEEGTPNSQATSGGQRAIVIALVVNFACALVMLGLSHHRATGQDCAMQFYPATIPTMVQSGLAALAALAGIVLMRGRKVCLILSGVLLGLLIAPANHALSHWPGGDDGGGFGWLFIVVGGSLVSFFVAFTTMLAGMFFATKAK